MASRNPFYSKLSTTVCLIVFSFLPLSLAAEHTSFLVGIGGLEALTQNLKNAILSPQDVHAAFKEWTLLMEKKHSKTFSKQLELANERHPELTEGQKKSVAALHTIQEHGGTTFSDKNNMFNANEVKALLDSFPSKKVNRLKSKVGEAFFKEFDTDGDVQITIPEFIDGLKKYSKKEHKKT